MMLIGAHISTAGGMPNALPRAAEIDASAIQIFTKQPSRWADKPIPEADAEAFRVGVESQGIGFTCAHDSYLINLATPDPTLRDRSLASFKAELERSAALALDAIVTHPGNATDKDPDRGIVGNGAMIARALSEVESTSTVLIETTAGSGSVLGSNFEEIARLMEAIGAAHLDRIGVCLDTCHVYSAGYDIREDFDGVIGDFDRIIGLEHLRLLHLNDSMRSFGSRKDRHAEIGEGSLGDEPFRRIMTDPRLAHIPRVLETPKGDDPAAADRRNLARLRALQG
jgi:deoxyribonuclease-4